MERDNMSEPFKLSPTAALALFSIIATVYLKAIDSEEQLERLVADLRDCQATVLHQPLARQLLAASSDDLQAVDDLLGRLIRQLRASYRLYHGEIDDLLANSNT